MIPIWHAPQLAAILGLASGVLVGLVALRFAVRARTTLDNDWAYAISTTGMLMAWPLTWDHGFLILLLPVLLLWRQRSSLNRTLQIVFLMALAALWIGEDWFWFLLTGTRVGVVATPWHVVTALSVHLYALMTLLGLECVAAEKVFVLWTSQTNKSGFRNRPSRLPAQP
jgi:hypothetical protein